MYRFFSQQEYSEKIFLQGTDAYHIANVLRMQTGEKMQIVTSDRYLVLAEISSIKAGIIELKSLEILDKFVKLNRVVLAQGLIKGDKMDYVVQKAVELGVTDIYLLKLSRCIVDYDLDKAIKKISKFNEDILSVTVLDDDSVKKLKDNLVKILRKIK